MKNIFNISYLRNIFIISVIITLSFPVCLVVFLYPSFIAQLTKNTEEEAVRVAKHLRSEFFQNQNKAIKDYFTPESKKEIQTAVTDFQLVELKVFSSSGEIIFSTNSNEIGEINKNRYFRELIEIGKPYTKLIKKGSPSLEGKTLTAEVIETYVPILDDNNPIGAFEIYYDITERKERVKGLVATYSMVLFILAGSLLSVLVFVLNHAGSNIVRLNQAEKSLRESEERYQDIFQNVSDFLYFHDTEGFFIEANLAFKKIAGYTDENLSNLNIIDLLPESLKHKSKDYIKRVMERGNDEGIMRVVSIDGRELDVEYKNSMVYDTDGKPIGVRGSARDITKRIKTEQALKLTQFAIDHASDAAFWMGSDARFVYINEAACRVLGYSKEELLTMSIHDIDPNFSHESWPELWAQIKLKSALVIESNHRTKDGRLFPVETTVNYLKFRDHEYICAFARDITERQKSEKILQSEKEKFRILVEESPFGVSLIGKDYHNKYLNPKFVELFGYTLEDIPTGRDWFSKAYPDPEYRRQVRSIWKSDFKNLSTGESRQRLFKVKCKDGTEKDINFRPVMMETGDFFVIYENVTEQKHLEAQLRQAQKMESIGTLAGGIAHDFNNLLMGIQGRASLMSLDIDSSHRFYEHLKGIEELVKSSADLTKQLLGFARIGKYDVKPLDLNEVIGKSSDMFGRTKKEIIIHKKFEKDIWPVEADQSQIEQVLLNLYVNAGQAMAGTGDLYLQTANVTLREHFVRLYGVEPGKYVKITITDTGAGIDEAIQDKIFDPFFTTKEMSRGTGLGLASTYGIIKSHGGIINVSSKAGKGATFNIYLPASEKEAVTARAPAEEMLKGSETVLLVDDEDMVINVSSQILKTLGYKVLLASSGEKAIERLKEHIKMIDLVILDMVMPGLGGGETYDRLKEINPEIKVLLSSGYSLEGNAKTILDRGCNGFIQKPFNIRQLSQKIREVLDFG